MKIVSFRQFQPRFLANMPPFQNLQALYCHFYTQCIFHDAEITISKFCHLWFFDFFSIDFENILLVSSVTFIWKLRAKLANFYESEYW